MTRAFVGTLSALAVAAVVARDGYAAGAWMAVGALLLCALVDGVGAVVRKFRQAPPAVRPK